MAEWIYFIHSPREDFAATMTAEEEAVWAVHFARFKRLLSEGVIILVGPTLGHVNTGICIFEAPDETTARRIMEEDPVIAAATPAASCARTGSLCCAAGTADGREEHPPASPRVRTAALGPQADALELGAGESVVATVGEVAERIG